MRERAPARARWARIVHAGSLAILALMIAAVVVGSIAGEGAGEGGADPIFLVLTIVVVAGFSTLGRLIVTRANNVIGWVFLVMAGALALGLPAEGYLDAAFSEPYVASLPGTEVAGMVANLFPFLMALALPMLFLLFPTGAPPTSRWRWVTRTWLVGGILTFVWVVFRPEPVYSEPNRFRIPNPIGLEFLRPLQPLFLDLGVLILVASAVLSIASLVVRYRRAVGEERQQIKWLMLVALVAGALFLALMVAPLIVDGLEGDALWIAFVMTLVLGIPIATALAIFRYRLYDVDVVVSKTIAYAALAAGIVAAYAAIVVGIGEVIGDRANELLRIAATAVVAVAVQPAWALFQRLANRLVYGGRATPYDVMAAFGRRVADVPSADQILPDMAEAAARGVGARAARVRLFLPGSGPDRRVRSATWPPGADVASPTLTLPIDHAGEQVGDLAIAKAPGEPLRAAERGLLEDLAAHAGMAFENARLSLDLEGRVEELAARTEEFRRSRERLVTVRDAQRRRLEQELRDGVGAEIARIRDQIGFDAERVTTHAQEVRASLEHLSERTDAALEDLRAVARGIFPPLLADEGLEFALSALARRSGPHVVLSVDGGGSGIRYDPAAEAAIYFCCVQALQNAERHAAGHAVGLTLRPRPDAVSFTVRDEGEGFDPQETRDGEGFQIMRDRIAALGGTLTIESAPGDGTTVTGTIPARVLEVVG